MAGGSKSSADYQAFFDAHITDQQFSDRQEYAFLLGYYTHLVTDVYYQNFVRNPDRVAACFSRLKAQHHTAGQIAGRPETFDTLKSVFGRKVLFQDIAILENNWVFTHPNSVYDRVLRKTTSFPDYLPLFPKGAYPRKIAIMTGTVSQGEEEFRAAEKAIATWGADHIITATYPDNFMSEMETTVSTLVGFASDPDVKAIVMCQAVPGAKAGFDKIREMGRDDILLIAGTPQEDPAVISAAADIVMYADEVAQGDTIMETCANWGIDVLIHYSFPRHMAMELIVGRHELMQQNADALGIELVDVTAPDPTAEAGLSASQQFILEDVPQQLAKYEGKKVAFFTTNCGMQPSLQAACLDEPNAYYPQPCCPSPYHGYPSALGIESPSDLVAGLDSTVAALNAKMTEAGLEGHFSTWSVPCSIANTVAATEYAWLWMAGLADDCDGAILGEVFKNYVKTDVALTPYDDPETNETFANYFVYTQGFLTFGELAGPAV